MKKGLGGAILILCFLCLAGFWTWVGVTDGKQPQEFVRQYFPSTPRPTATPWPTLTPRPTLRPTSRPTRYPTRRPTRRPTPTPSFSYWFDEGTDDLREGRYRAAIGNFDEAIRLNPVSAPSYNERGVAKGSLHRYEEAILDFSRAIEIESSNACYFANRGRAKTNLKQFQEGLIDLDYAIALRSRFDEAFTSRGYVKLLLEEYKSAIEDFDQAISMRNEPGTGTKIELCPAEQETGQEVSPTLGSTPAPDTTPTSGQTATPTPTLTPNPCPSDCFSDNDARFIQTYLWRGEAHYSLGNYEAALADLETALELAHMYEDTESAESAQDLIDAIK